MNESEDQVLEAASHWVATLKRGALSRQDQRALKAWLDQDAGHAAALDLMMDVWGGVEPLRDRPVAALARPSRRPARRVAWTWGPAGGLVLAAAAIALVAVPFQSHTYVTAVGRTASIALPDHSTVWLNTGTTLKVSYTGLRRDLRLERGEAEFRVAHEALRPFLVSTANATVRATGTDFTVRYDGAGGGSRVVLVQGTVRVSGSGEGATPTPLHAGYSLFAPATGPFQVAKADPEVDLAWRQGQLVFYQRPIAEVVQEFARYGGVRVHFADPAVEHVRISGVFRATDFKSFLRDIEVLNHIRSYTDDKGEVVVATGA